MKTLLKSLAIGLYFLTGLQAMEPESMDVVGGSLLSQGQEAQKMTPKEEMEENIYKIWLLKAWTDDNMDEFPKDVKNVIVQTFVALLRTNPVLIGKLKYKEEPILANIIDLVKADGYLDLPNRIFGDASNYLRITTDPEQFFHVVENSQKVVILIAPKFLIEEKIGLPCCTSFEKIMDKTNWNDDLAPIGIFYRAEYWKDKNWYDYITNASIVIISSRNLYENWSCNMQMTPAPWPYFGLSLLSHSCEKFHFYFKQKLD